MTGAFQQRTCPDVPTAETGEGSALRARLESLGKEVLLLAQEVEDRSVDPDVGKLPCNQGKLFPTAWDTTLAGPGALRRSRPPLPDVHCIEQIIERRDLRRSHFDHDLFADPAWDMILDLTVARLRGRRISVSSLCTAARVPPTTALRWIGMLVERGLFERFEDDQDKRRAFIALSDAGAARVASYFDEIHRKDLHVL